MPVRPLIFYPDPLLRRPAEPVSVFNAALRAQASDVAETLSAVAAAGLTGPHLGVLARIVVLQPDPDEPAETYVNPELVWRSDDRVEGREGSVSMPGVSEIVARARAVRVRFRDLDGAEREAELADFRAACLQHEVDQLDGVFWIERLSRLRRERVVKRFMKLQARGG